MRLRLKYFFQIIWAQDATIWKSECEMRWSRNPSTKLLQQSVVLCASYQKLFLNTSEYLFCSKVINFLDIQSQVTISNYLLSSLDTCNLTSKICHSFEFKNSRFQDQLYFMWVQDSETHVCGAQISRLA